MWKCVKSETYEVNGESSGWSADFQWLGNEMNSTTTLFDFTGESPFIEGVVYGPYFERKHTVQ